MNFALPRIILWKWETGSESYGISNLFQPFLIPGRSAIASLTQMVRYGADSVHPQPKKVKNNGKY